MNGTNLGTGSLSDTVNPTLVDVNGYALLVTAPSSAAIASTAGYQVGCLLQETTAGKLYINTGSTTSATWTVVGSQS